MRKRILVSALAATALAGTALAGLGPHDRTADGSVTVAGGACAYCHNNTAAAALRGFKSANTITGSGWYNRPIAQLCYNCHMGYLGGNNVLDPVYDNGAAAPASHGFNATATGKAIAATGGGLDPAIAASNLPYTTGTAIDCTSCHNVHEANNVPFMTKQGTATSPVGMQINELCAACHSNRDSNASATATHPVRIPIGDTTGLTGTVIHTPAAVVAETANRTSGWFNASGVYQLGPKTELSGAAQYMGCPTCHTVHKSGEATPAAYEDYTFRDNKVASGATVANKWSGDDSEFCQQCHSAAAADGVLSTVRGVSDHPINEYWLNIRNPSQGTGATGSNIFYPATVMLPNTWLTSNGDTSPAPFVNNGPVGYAASGVDADADPSDNGGPHCSSCHEMHGAQAATKLYQAPAVSTEGNFCFECHASNSVVPARHHSTVYTDEAPFVSVLDCGSCHGQVAGLAWAAHGGFQSFNVNGTVMTAEAATPTAGGGLAPGFGRWNYDLCVGCHEATNPTTFTAGSNIANNTVRLGSSHGNPSGALSHYVSVTGDTADNESSFNAVVPAAAVTATLIGTGTEAQAFKLGPSNEFGCESCHNLLKNVGDPTDATTVGSGGWKANLLVGNLYEDDNARDHTTGVKPNEQIWSTYSETVLAGRNTRDLDGGPTGDDFCRRCHTSATNGYVHAPAAHTETGVTNGGYTYPAPVPYPHTAAETGILTSGHTLADSLYAPIPRSGTASTKVFAYTGDNTMDCDTCHRPHNADNYSTGPGEVGTINTILEVGAMDSNPATPAADTGTYTLGANNPTKSDPCLLCHDPFYQP